MLAALRVLHVDPSHAPAEIAWTQEQPSLAQEQQLAKEPFVCTNPQSNRTKKTRRWLREERPASRL
jgi:hypothetical protein